MKGVILAGGTGSRLAPVTSVLNKHMLPINGYPMIHYPINTLAQSGVSEVVVVLGHRHIEPIVAYLGSGARYNVRISYIVQDRPGGIAEALQLTRPWVGDSRFAMILGDNIFQNDFMAAFQSFVHAKEPDAVFFLKQVADPRPYGVAEIRDGRITRILEKPVLPPSDLIVTGLYLYDGTRIYTAVDRIKASARGEYEISDANTLLLQEGTVGFHSVDGGWLDAGTVEAFGQAQTIVNQW